jgi:hypothetical protein
MMHALLCVLLATALQRVPCLRFVFLMLQMSARLIRRKQRARRNNGGNSVARVDIPRGALL